MSVIFKTVVAYIATYKANEVIPPKRGRPKKIIQDIDRTKVDEVIYDTKLDDGMRSEIGIRKPRRKRTNRQD
jgi:hypothetical protein